MAWGDFGYMEDGRLGKPYDLGLLTRLAAQAKGKLKLIGLAGFLILLSTGLDLLLPYLTKTAIDDYIVRQALLVDLAKAGAAQVKALKQGLDRKIISTNDPGKVFVPEKAFKDLDPRVLARLRADGAIAKEPWHIVSSGPGVSEVMEARPGLFKEYGDRVLIKSSDLKKLSPDNLYKLRNSDITGLIWLAVIFLGACVLAAGLGFFQQVILERAGQEMMFELRQKLYAHILSRAPSFFTENAVGNLTTRLTNDVQNLNEMYRNSIIALCKDVVLLTGIVVVLLLLDVTLTLVCLVLVPVIAVAAWFFARLAREAFRALQGHLGRINARFQETISGISVLKLFRAEDYSANAFSRLNNAYFQAGMRQIKVFAVFMPLAGFFSNLAVALIIWYGGGQVIQDRLSLGALAAFLFYMQMFFRPVRDVAEKYNVLQAAMASAERIFNIMDNQTALSVVAKPSPFPDKEHLTVCFEKVTFGYLPSETVLQDISFAIPAGETWAVVGPTGAGKTSVVNLVLRLYDPWQGRVFLDGVDLRRADPLDLAAKVALVPQEVFIKSGTIKHNITLGRERVTEENLDMALSVTGAGEFVNRLEKGLHTKVGSGGQGLSAGQRQLIALARALAGDPGLLVLDEATSAVDPVSEKQIQRALPKVMQGRTSLVVAHRLSTVRRADNILVMKKGRICEQGTHAELLKKNGVYAGLVRHERLRG
ncbi:ABC transporter ATP-binding protein [Dethiosulfatarculus sandiegensis]|uniref:ABC transporter ATP-binding protein n=1 Tax=Dethiosulfatarculus sandiegensis TaxID=1429043 RepID=A0A0D2HWR7_9BACT|nr:ABC transporter ATP-binding protein [Dethiosulfatarculus sandiegensis]KIX14818.1 hypothetical protein X474_06645 [Dethiosulfatarculus sandiegensis]